MNRFDTVQKLKNDNNLIINNINYGRVLAVLLYRDDIKYKIALIIRSLITKFKFKYKKNNNPIFLMYAFKDANRKDFDYITDKFCELSGSDKFYVRIEYSKFIRIIKISCIKNYYKKLKKIEYISFLDKILICSLIARYDELREIFEVKVNEFDVIVTFCDAHPIDNLLAQIANNREKVTATLQHGQYKVISKGNEIADVELYLNFISNYLFAWGQKTVDEFSKIGIDPKRILKVGALKEFSYNKFIERELRDKENGIFGVILDADQYMESNIELIKLANKIAKEYKIKYVVRLHPRNNLKKYKRYLLDNFVNEIIEGVSNIEYVSKVDFSIIHLAGVYIELLSMNVPFFILEDKFTEDIFKDNLLNFSNYEEFNKVYNYFVNNKDEFYYKLKKKYEDFNSYNIEYNYKKYLERIKDEIMYANKGE